MNERGIRGNMITRSGLPEGKNEASNLVGFEKAISQTYAPMAIDSPRDAPDHEWEVNRQPLGLISVSVVAYQGPVHGQISAAAMDQGERKIVLMSVERGAVELEQRGRLSRCDPGMMMLMDVAHPLDVRQHTSTVILSATIPTAFLRAQCGEIEQHCCVSVPAAVGTASVLRDMLKSMLREHQRIDPNAARVLSSSFSTLVSSVFREPGEAKALSDPAPMDDWQGAMGRITDVLDRDCGNLRGTEGYLCGPPPMIDSAIAVLKAKGMFSTRIRFDKFVGTGSRSESN